MQTVMNFELGRGTPRKATAIALQVLFYQEGIHFDDDGNLILPT
jgi:hypothetical protein